MNASLLTVPKKSATPPRATANATAPSSDSSRVPAGLPRFLQRHSPVASSPPLEAQPLVSAPALGPSAEQAARSTSSARYQTAMQGVAGMGEPLPYHETLQRAFGPTHDLTGVRAHIGGTAAQASARLHAEAYATGDRVAFAFPPDLQLAAHEAAHVVQQRNGVSLSGGLSQSGDVYERHADAIAARVGSGESVAELLPPSSSHGNIAPALQFKEDVSASPQTSMPSPTDSVLSVLYLHDPQTGESDYHMAILILDRMEMSELLHTLDDLARRNLLTGLFPHIGAPFDYDQGRLVSAMRIVRLNHPELGTLSGREAEFMGRETAALPMDEQQAIIEYLSAGLNSRDFARLSVEGASVLGISPSEAASSPTAEESDQGSPAQEDGSSTSLTDAQNMSVAMGGAPPVYGPGFWRPGNRREEHIGAYIGTTAHLAIAEIYKTAHPGDIVYTNYFSVQKIVNDFAAMELQDAIPFRLSKTQLEGEPDIANISQRHLYEIKPAGSEMLAFTKAEEYCEALTLAGVPITLGPMWEQGTFGFFYDAGWYFIFDSPLPGVIVYRRQQKPPPEMEPAEEPVEQTALQEETEDVTDMVGVAAWLDHAKNAVQTGGKVLDTAEAAEDTTASEGLIARFCLAFEAAE